MFGAGHLQLSSLLLPAEIIRPERLHPACWNVWPTAQILVRQLSVFRLATQKLPIHGEALRDGRKCAAYLASTNFNGSVTGVGKLGCRISRSARPEVSA